MARNILAGSTGFVFLDFLGLGSHVGPQGFTSNLAVSFGLLRCHVGKVEIVLRLPLMLQGRWTETHFVPFGYPRSCQDSPLHGGEDFLPIGSLFGYRSIIQFAVELAKFSVDDPCFDLVDHVASTLFAL